MVAFFVRVSSAWCAVDMSVEEAQAWCVALLTAFVPARLRRQFGVVPGRWFLPYCYNSMKPKCFSNGRRSCEKPGHSCMRRIVSYVKWPAGRALTFILQMTICIEWNLGIEYCPSWSRAEDGALASCQTSRAVWPLSWCLCRNPGKYCRCGPVLWMRVCLWSLLCVGRSTDVGRKNGHTTVMVVGSRVVFFGGCIFRSLRRCRVFFMEDLYWLFAAACSTQVWSISGLSIGGLLSKVAASTVLGWQEHCWNFDQNRRQVADSGGMIGCGLTLLLVGHMSMTSFGSAGRFALGALKKGCSMLTQCPLRSPFLEIMVCWLGLIFLLFCPLCVGQQSASNLCHLCHGRLAKPTLSVCYLGESLVGRRCSCCLKIWQRRWCSCFVISWGQNGKNNTSAVQFFGLLTASNPLRASCWWQVSMLASRLKFCAQCFIHLRCCQ